MNPKPMPKNDIFFEGELWVEKERAYELWFGFLALSPSYELAHRFRRGKLTDEHRKLLPADFERVLAVYDDLGDVSRLRFDLWWNKVGLKNFGRYGQPPAVTLVSKLGIDELADASAEDSVRAYMEGAWRLQGSQGTLLVALPMGLSKKLLLEQIGELIDANRTPNIAPKTLPPKYPLHRKRQDNRSLVRYLRLAWIRSFTPRPLWFIGYSAQFSDTYTKRLKPMLPDRTGVAKEEKERLKILTNRGLKRVMLIAENAARGVFPSYDDCPNAVSPGDFPIYQIFHEQRRASRLLEWWKVRNAGNE